MVSTSLDTLATVFTGDMDRIFASDLTPVRATSLTTTDEPGVTDGAAGTPRPTIRSFVTKKPEPTTRSATTANFSKKSYAYHR
jgi:hypothetical protein